MSQLPYNRGTASDKGTEHRLGASFTLHAQCLVLRPSMSSVGNSECPNMIATTDLHIDLVATKAKLSKIGDWV
jgi:hypothetical protein